MDFRIFRLLVLFLILVFAMSVNTIIAHRNFSQEKHIVDDFNLSSKPRSISLHPKTTKITPGFYFRKADDHNDLGELNYNEYNWLYIKRNYEVQFFFTLDAEHCLVDLVYEKSP